MGGSNLCETVTATLSDEDSHLKMIVAEIVAELIVAEPDHLKGPAATTCGLGVKFRSGENRIISIIWPFGLSSSMVASG